MQKLTKSQKIKIKIKTFKPQKKQMSQNKAMKEKPPTSWKTYPRKNQYRNSLKTTSNTSKLRAMHAALNA